MVLVGKPFVHLTKDVFNMIEQLKSNLLSVRQRIADAAVVAGRSAEDVRLIGVTKYVDAATTRALAEAGCMELGESRPQVLWEKAEALVDLQIRRRVARAS